MNKLSRRRFGTSLLTAAALPFVPDSLLRSAQGEESAPLPNRVAGYTMTEPERTLALKFLEHYERTMKPLRERDMPNGLAPAFDFASPIMKGETGERER